MSVINRIDKMLGLEDLVPGFVENINEQKGKGKDKKKWGKVTHPGVLEVPAGKSVTSLPAEYFIKLAKKKGRGLIVRALMNLYRWNKKDNPKLSKWAKKTQEAVSASFA